MLSFATMVVVFYSTRLLLQIISFAVLSSLCELGFFFFGYPLSPQPPPPPRRPSCQIFPTSVGHTLLHYALTRPLSFFSVEAIRRRNIHPIQKHTHTRHTHTHTLITYIVYGTMVQLSGLSVIATLVDQRTKRTDHHHHHHTLHTPNTHCSQYSSPTIQCMLVLSVLMQTQI